MSENLKRPRLVGTPPFVIRGGHIIGRYGFILGNMAGNFYASEEEKEEQIYREAIKQEDPLGCAVACVAYALNKTYQQSLALFENGKEKAIATGFTCPEIVKVLKDAGLNYTYSPVGHDTMYPKTEFDPKDIIFIKPSSEYPVGHYLTRVAGNIFMDPWINYPQESRRSGFRTELPSQAKWIIWSLDLLEDLQGKRSTS